MTKDLEKEKQIAAKEAVKFITDNQIIGLGTGSTATYAILEIGKLVHDGLKIKAVPTSAKTRSLAASLNIPITDINSVNSVDITIDGADEFTEDLNLIKGGGGALYQEKNVASITKNLIIIADSSKKVDVLGKFKLPVEVAPFAYDSVLNQIESIKGSGNIRMTLDKPFMTDQGNYIIDADFGLISNPVLLSNTLDDFKGIVGHGLFIGLTQRVIMGKGDATITYKINKI
ncbi:ribose-5-phosphate isomerase RpiA [Flavobacterium sp. 3-210]